MELTITNTIFIDIDEIIQIYNNNSLTIEEAVDNYLCGCDDVIYYLVGENETEQIIQYIKTKLK